MARFELIGFARGVVRALAVLNLACGAAFLVALAFSWPGAGMMLARLAAKYGARLDAVAVVWGMREMLVLGILAAVAAHRLLAALLAMMRSVAAGDPFAEEGAARLRTIGRSLLAIQFLDLAFGWCTHRIAALGAEVPIWSPSVTGWLGVLVAFVLAEVFARGAAMRDELAGTI